MSKPKRYPYTKENIGLVLPGGGANGAYSAHAVNELVQAGYSISAVTGISVGALNGAAITTGKLDELIDTWERITHDDVYTREWLPIRILRMILGKADGLYSTEPLKGLLEEIYDPNYTEIPLSVGAVSVATKEYIKAQIQPLPGKRAYSNEQVQFFRDMIRASASVPLYAEPVEKITLGDKEYFGMLDGGIVEIAPLSDMFDMVFNEDAVVDRIIVVAPGSVPEKPDGRRRGGGTPKDTSNIIKIASRLFPTVQAELIYNDVNESLKINDLVLQAAENGVELLRPGRDRPYEYVPVDVIQPRHGLGDGRDFSRDAYEVRKKMALETAQAFIRQDTRNRRDEPRPPEMNPGSLEARATYQQDDVPTE